MNLFFRIRFRYEGRCHCSCKQNFTKGMRFPIYGQTDFLCKNLIFKICWQDIVNRLFCTHRNNPMRVIMIKMDIGTINE